MCAAAPSRATHLSTRSLTSHADFKRQGLFNFKPGARFRGSFQRSGLRRPRAATI